jgi:hypothetical protein
MRTLLALAFMAASTVSLAGCPAGLGCGGYSGGGDQVYARGNDVLILCENGAFVEQLSGQPEVDGMAQDGPGSAGLVVQGTVQDTATVAFTLSEDAEANTATAPELGSGAFTLETLGTVELNYANLNCTRVGSASWFPGNSAN